LLYRCDGAGEAELGDLLGQTVGMDPWRAVEVVGTEVFLDGAIAQHVVDRGEEERGYGADRLPFVTRVLGLCRRGKKAAKRLFRKLLKKPGRAPRVLITDELRSYAAAKREIMPGVEHRQHKGFNNRAENSHQPTRRREQIMKRFKSPRQVQRFFPPMIGSPTSSPAAPAKTPPPSFILLAVKPSPSWPSLPAWRWLRNHARRPAAIKPIAPSDIPWTTS
jgi:hypothetical protein